MLPFANSPRKILIGTNDDAMYAMHILYFQFRPFFVSLFGIGSNAACCKLTHTFVYAHNHANRQIISMENNSIRAKGTYRDIETDDAKLIQEWNSIIAKENAQDESIRYLFLDPQFCAKVCCNGQKSNEKSQTLLTLNRVYSCFFFSVSEKRLANDGNYSKISRKLDFNVPVKQM